MEEQNDLLPILPNDDDEEDNKQEEGKEEENAQKDKKGEDKKKEEDEKEEYNEQENFIIKREKDEKEKLQKKLKELEGTLEKNINKTIPESYEDYLNNEDITKRNIKEGTNECLIAFMFYVIAPIFGVIFLIGIFQIISLKKALSDLIKRSLKDYYQCQIRSNCNMTIISNMTEYRFYDYFYESSMNETIDFNLMMITAFIGELFLKSRGFRISSGTLSLINLGCMFWIYNFDTSINEDSKEYFSIIKVISMIVSYLILLIGIGGSALLSQKILIDSHLKYKEHNIKGIRKRIDLKRKETLINGQQPQELKSINDEQNELLIRNKKKIEKEKNIEEKREERLKKREKNKFDFFFMICLTTTLGYFGKYGINLLIDFIIARVKDSKDYDKKIYFESIIILYASSIILSICFYSIFVCIFTKNKKDQAGDNVYRICQVCGFIIYSEQVTLKKESCCRCKCLQLCCESTKNCCNEAACVLINNFFCDAGCECCCCCCCDYDPEHYDKNEEFFCYCYKTQRKSFWCNNFLTNKAQKKLVPYMMEYFLLQLTTIGLEQQYEDYKGKFVHRKTFTSIFLGSFILYFYLTLSFAKQFKDEDDEESDDKNDNRDKGDGKNEYDIKNKDEDDVKNEDKEKKEEKLEDTLKISDIEGKKVEDNNEDKDNEHKMKEKEVEKKTKFSKYKDGISKLSNDILDGTHAIFFFNGVFSLIFSAFYFSKINIKNYIFENNVNIFFLPILMNKFYYFTMNYYCLYTSEDNKKFDFISSSTIISLYMGVWDLILMGLKYIIKHFSKEKYVKILFIVQMSISSIPSLIIGIILLALFCVYSKLCYFIICCSDDEFKTFRLFHLLFCLLSFIICFGGCWYNFSDIENGSDCDEICENICYCISECCCDCDCQLCECFCCCCECCDCCCCCCDITSCCYCECCDDCWDFVRYSCCLGC